MHDDISISCNFRQIVFKELFAQMRPTADDFLLGALRSLGIVKSI